MADIASIGLEIRSKGLQRGVQELNRLKKNGADADASMGKLAKRFVLVATAVAGATTAVAAYTNHVAQQVLEVERSARALGISTQALQQWQFAAERVGLSGDNMVDIIKDTGDRLGDLARTGGGEAADLFNQLNLNIQDFIKMEPDEQVRRVGEAIAGLGTQAEKNFFAESIANDFSRLIPLFENGSAELEDLFRQAQQFGIALSDVDNTALTEMAKNVEMAQTRVEGLGRMFSAELAPAMNVALEAVQDLIGMIDRDDIANFVEVGVDGFGVLADGVYYGQKAVLELATSVARLGTVVTSSMADNAKATANFINKALAPVQTVIGAILEKYGDLVGVMSSAARWAGLDTMADGMDIVANGAQAAAAGMQDLTVTVDGIEDLNKRTWDLYNTLVSTKQALIEAGEPSERMNALIAEMKTRLEEQTNALDENTKSTGASVGQTEAQIKAAQAAAKALKKQKEELRRLLDELDPVGAANRKFEESQKALKKALDGNLITLTEYNKQMKLLRESMMSDQTAAQAYSQGFGGQIASRGTVGAPNEQAELTGIDQWMQEARTNFANFGNLAASTAQTFSSSFGTAFTDVISGQTSMTEGFRSLAQTILTSVISALAQMAAQWAALQIAQLALGQTAAAASVAQAAATGPSIAAAYAPAASMVSLATFGTNAAAASAGIASTTATAQGLALTGMAHDGISNIPTEGTWLLNKGERVLNPQQNADLTSFLASGGGRQQQSSMPPRVTVNNIEDNSKAGTAQSRMDQDGGITVDNFIADVRNDGPMSQAMTKTFQFQRKGR